MELQRWIERLSEPRVLIGIAVAVVVLLLLRRLFARPQQSAHVALARCDACGWTGQVSKFKPVCPRCAKPARVG